MLSLLLWSQAATATLPTIAPGPYGVDLVPAPETAARIATTAPSPGEGLELWLEVVCPAEVPEAGASLTLRILGADLASPEPLPPNADDGEVPTVSVAVPLADLCDEPATAVFSLQVRTTSPTGLHVHAVLEHEGPAPWRSEGQLTLGADPATGEGGWFRQSYWAWAKAREAALAAVPNVLADHRVRQHDVAFDPTAYGLPRDVGSARVVVEAGKAYLEGGETADGGAR